MGEVHLLLLRFTCGVLYPLNFKAPWSSGESKPLLCNLFQGAVWYGLVVHMRIYPIIYALPIVILLDPLHFQHCKKPSIIEWSSRDVKPGASLGLDKSSNLNRLWVLFSSIFTRSRILFGLISATIFFFFTGVFFYLYEREFLNEALLYHLTRTDPRHNFSIYFYHIYLNYEREFSVLEKLISFLPQLIVQVVLVSHFARDLPFCFFVQTVAFVAFNKLLKVVSEFAFATFYLIVVTSQNNQFLMFEQTVSASDVILVKGEIFSDYGSILCVVLLSPAINTTMEQNETEMG
ncbi:GPI mannosyltransferase 1, partial [Tanacetum coccineum]